MFTLVRLFVDIFVDVRAFDKNIASDSRLIEEFASELANLGRCRLIHALIAVNVKVLINSASGPILANRCIHVEILSFRKAHFFTRQLLNAFVARSVQVVELLVTLFEVLALAGLGIVPERFGRAYNF